MPQNSRKTACQVEAKFKSPEYDLAGSFLVPFAINAKAGETCGAFPTPLLTVFCYNLFCTWTAEGYCTRDLPERIDPASVALLLEVP